MSFFAGLDSEQYDRQYSDRELMKRMAGYFQQYRRSLLWVVGLLLLIGLAGAALPVIVSRGVDLLKTGLTPLNIGLITGAILLVGVLTWLANWMRRRLVVRMIGDVILRLRSDAFRAAMQHDLSFYDQNASGRVVSRITTDTNDFGQTVVLVTDLVSQFLEALILALILLNINLRLALYLLGLMPLIFLVAYGFRSLARRVTRMGMRAMANVNSAIKETVSGIAIAKNFRQEQVIYSEFDAANRQSYRVNVQRGLVLSMVFPLLNTIGGMGMAMLVYTGGLSVAAGFVTSGAWYLFLNSLDLFFFPVLNLSSFWAQVQTGLSAAERVFALIDARPEVVQAEQRKIYNLRGEICFEGACFRYSRQELVLQDFNLYIQPGENLALVGHTGAGKSSIAKLLARFYEFQEGRILVDGVDIRSLDLTYYRRKLGIVTQVPFLFSGTVADNICYACPEVDLKAIEAVANQIGEGEWLETLPLGLQTEVGERGSRLSMGQRQLVSLLRVLVQRPAIFILDEATASIDPFTEWQIQQALNLILANTTSILIAHRLSTVKAADRIIVLDRGKIIEEGDHAALLDQGGHYATLYNTYFRHQSLDYRPEGLDEFLETRLKESLD
ncbi:MAG TPA: ABC transporter ATP-binding protein [Anaerolineales bacterium]|nr:ABC transporter ATP-binding protein [Anaerolineales bacterium]